MQTRPRIGIRACSLVLFSPFHSVFTMLPLRMFAARAAAAAFAGLAAFVPVAQAQLAPPPIAAKSWLLVDVTSGQTLAAQDADARVDPASLTKLMTAYLSFAAIKSGAIKTTDTLTISEHAWRAEGSRMFADPKVPVSIDELLHGMIIQSGNDATIALAERVGGSEPQFVELMNRKAAEFGMKSTQFRDSSGLPDPNHYSTARDLATLAQHVITDFPEFLPLYSQREYTYNKIRQANRNRLLWQDPSVDGLKTGHTEAAGFCLIATAKRDLPAPIKTQRRVLSVVLGTASDAARAQESQKLLNYAYQNYDDVRLFEGNAAVQSIPVFKGRANAVAAGTTRDLFVSVPRGQADKLKASVERNERLVAPIRAGQQVGTIKVTLDGKPYRELPLLALADVPEAGVFGRALDTIRLWFK